MGIRGDRSRRRILNRRKQVLHWGTGDGTTCFMLITTFYRMTLLSCLAALPLFAAAHEGHEPEITVEAAGTSTPVLRITDFGTTVPYTNLKLNNAPSNFQFAIVTDRTGGLRPGIFDDAVRKLNLLQPEFVMSVGDLIMGYTRDKDELNRQWTEFDDLVGALKMPFFYVPGNHDVTYPVQKKLWSERIGPLYYHFVYGDVLFLCLNSEDPSSAMSMQQVEYFRKVLEQNKEVRWTLAFLHRPLWTAAESAPEMLEEDAAAAAAGAPDSSYHGWSEFEKLLAGRPHTVFAGHVHRYTKYVRNDQKYITLATTGGGTALRGAQYYGEFDHVVWVTMTDEGPVLANLELRGIWDEDVRTQDVAQLVNPVLQGGVLTRPAITEPVPFAEASAQLRLTNTADIPMKIAIEFQPHQWLKVEPAKLDILVHPNSVELPDVKLLPREATMPDEVEPIRLKWRAVYDDESRPHIALDGERQMAIDSMHWSPRVEEPVALDGDLSEWTTLPLVCRAPAVVAGKKNSWRGPKDAHFRMATRHDAKHVYVAVQVTDDQWVRAGKQPQQGDGIEVRLDPRGARDAHGAGFAVDSKKLRRAKGAKGAASKSIMVAAAAPPSNRGQARARPQDVSTTGPVIVARRSDNGYTAEVAFPVEALVAEQGPDWTSYRLNVTVYDRDSAGGGTGENRSILWWRPDWNSPLNYPNSGTVLRQK